MAENREEILANFQGITAIEDVAEAIYHLEEANWDLLAAINRVMPQDGNSSAANDNDTHDVEMIDDDISVITPKTHPPVCRQQLSGLGGSRATSNATLVSLNLPPNAVLRLKAAETLMADDEVAERLTTTYVLHVNVEDKEYTLKYPGTKTVQEVKNDIYSLTDIPVRHQSWTGWPAVPGLDETVLAMAGLQLPQHELSVRRAPKKDYKRIIVESSDSENSSVEEVEDTTEGYTGEDDMFVDLVQTERLQPLKFAQRFRARYGPNTPQFFEGTLQDAIQESCLKPAKERKLLGVYLHHEQSVLSNVFCAQLLGCEAVLQTLAANFIVYGWDLTHPDNNNMAKEEVKKKQEEERNQELERAESERQMEEAKKEALLDFLASKGYPQQSFKVISSWPRRDLTLESPSSTLKALKLYPQETIMLEER
ncbi:hypothetical protein HF086_017732 [Spodoptera exigua]|uniref:UAS domain-containing protein n=1 Tax=Spodoptera exigua TaxID=7107 RepID=A0A922MA67_SPOEX|nr:hypothetical protein HF086_017732 [Spodoptera exigua]